MAFKETQSVRLPDCNIFNDKSELKKTLRYNPERFQISELMICRIITGYFQTGNNA